MTYSKLLRITVFFVFFLSSCKKNESIDNIDSSNGNITIEKLDGYVYADIPHAVVECAGVTTITDIRGYFSFNNITVNKESAKITVKNPSLVYTKQPELVTSFIPAAHGVHVLSSLNKLLTNYPTFNNQASGFITSTYLNFPKIIEFDANSFIDKNTNALITGNVVIDADLYSYLGAFGELATTSPNNPALVPYLGVQGSNYGISSSGNEVGLSIQSAILKCYFKSENGSDLAVNSGKKIKVKANGNFSPTTLPTQPIYLWYFDASRNRWIQDVQANAIPNGSFDGFYTAETDKLSNDYLFAYSYPVVKLSARIISNYDNKPVVNSLIRFAKQGDKTIVGTAYTDDNGYLTTLVPKDVSLDLSLLSPSGSNLTNSTNEDAIYNVNIGVKSTDADLGTIVVSSNTALTSNMLFNFKGVAVDCNKNPLINGVITIYDVYGFVHKVKVGNDGVFSINYTRPSGHSSLNWFATNSTGSDFSRVIRDLYVWKNWLTSQTIKKDYSVDTIILCNQNTEEFIELTIDGVTTNYSNQTSTFEFSEPNGGILYGFVFNQQVNMLGNTTLQFRYEGDRMRGIKSYVGGLFYNNQLLTYLSIPPKVTVTEDEYNGSNFISGFIPSATVKYPDNSTHTFACKFRVRR